jgi:hypothetical protein
MFDRPVIMSAVSANSKDEYLLNSDRFETSTSWRPDDAN